MPYPQKAPFAVDANGVPSDADCNSIDWATSYLDYAVGNAFGRLYNNYDNLGDAWAAYWKVVASKYMNFPGVMGYDLMNGTPLFFFLAGFCSSSFFQLCAFVRCVWMPRRRLGAWTSSYYTPA